MQPPPAERFARREGALRLLIVGGSLGAVAPERRRAVRHRSSRGLTLHVRHQAGERGIDAARERLRAKRGVQADVSPFIDDMARPTPRPIS